MRFNVPSDWTSWNDTVDNLLSDPSKRLMPTLMTPYSLVAETNAWLIERRRIQPGQKPWQSLRDEMVTCVSQLGPEMLHVVGQLLASIGDGLAELIQTETSSGIVENIAATLSLLQKPESGVAAWRDVVDAANSPDVAIPAMWYRRDVLIDIVVAQGKGIEFSGVLKTVMGVLADSTVDVLNARSLVGRPVDDPGISSRQMGMSTADREALVLDLFGSSGRLGHQVVWMLYERARVPGFRSFGKVSLFDSEMLRQALNDREPYNYWVPDELRGIDLRDAGLDHLPTELGSALVRVDLGMMPASLAVARAYETFDSIRTVIAPNAPGWRRGGLVVQFADGRPVLYSSGVPEMEELDYLWDTRFLEDVLDGHEDWITALSPISSPELRVAITYLSALVSSRNSSAQVAILSSINAAEHVNGMVFESRRGWPEESRNTLKNRWVLQRVTDDIAAALIAFSGSVGRYSHWLRIGASRSILEQYSAELFDSDGNISIQYGLVRLKELRSQVRSDSYGSRLLDNVQTYVDPASARLRVAAIRDEFELNLSRLRRARNAAAHGGPVTDGAVMDARAFANWTATRLIRAYINGIVHTTETRDSLEAIDRDAGNRLKVIVEKGVRSAYGT